MEIFISSKKEIENAFMKIVSPKKHPEMIKRIFPMTGIRENIPILFNRMQFLIGVLMLLLGSFIYATERHPDSIYFTRVFGIQLKLLSPDTHVLGAFGLRLPAFFHVLSFSLITAAFMSCSQKKYFGVCAGWFLVNCGFEMGQKYKLAAAGITPDFLKHLPFFENTRAYFLSGTFDWLDILAASVGAAAAFLIMLATKKYHFGLSSQTGRDGAD
jgi:hypothetical protein